MTTFPKLYSNSKTELRCVEKPNPRFVQVPMRCRKPLRRWLRRRVERQSWRLSCRRSRWGVGFKCGCGGGGCAACAKG
eukprot:350879-Chlamydomonas_euryale.AAC.3